ncbi:hypothetical protein GCM10009682_24090 [Luedemannella flava]|uniref:HIT domain-containing protein n=1 Tax=Luedemannella flava TaxID=349316 RepID=A0ABN2LWI1_9ACTN
MISHEPAGYRCPFCVLIAGGATDISGPDDVVARTDVAVAFIAPSWKPHNPGSVLVVSAVHVENLYTLPTVVGHGVHDLVQQVAVAIRRSYGCAGISTRQHNEPAGDQSVWHYHVHVSPRFDGDDLYRSLQSSTHPTREERTRFADLLRDQLRRASHQPAVASGDGPGRDGG